MDEVNQRNDADPAHQYADDELIVKYDDACLYGRDLHLMEDKTSWWTDDCINFQFQRLQRRCPTKTSGTVLIDPAVTSFLVHQCKEDDEYADFCKGYNNFDGVGRVLFAVNDNHHDCKSWNTPGQGRHWSFLLLILFDKEKKEHGLPPLPLALHFDSIKGSSNIKSARSVASKFYEAYRSVQLKQIRVSPTPLQLKVLECRTPQQENGNDCALHALAAAEAIVALNTTTEYTYAASDTIKSEYEGCVERLFRCSSTDLCQGLRQNISHTVRGLAVTSSLKNEIHKKKVQID